MPIIITNFANALPRMTPRSLPQNPAAAAWSINADTGVATLQGIRAPTFVVRLKETSAVVAPQAAPLFELGINFAQRIKREDDNSYLWVPLEDETSRIIRNPLTNDEFDRFYLFQKGQPVKVGRYSEIKAHGVSGFFPVKVASPSGPMDAFPNITDKPLLETRSYTHTFVTEWGEESAPAEAKLIEADLNSYVMLNNFRASPPPTLAGRKWEFIRIYRTVVGGSTVTYHWLVDIKISQTSYKDEVPVDELALTYTLTSQNDPPEDGIWGPRVHPTGSIVAFKDRSVYFSTPYLPHSWPQDLKIDLQDKIIGLEISGQNIFVITESQPYVLYGDTIYSMGILRFPDIYPGINHGSIVGVSGGIVFMSTEGLAMMTSQGVQIISAKTITRDQWRRDFIDETVTAVIHNGTYLALRKDGAGFSIQLSSGEVQILKTKYPFWSVEKDRYGGQTYIIAEDSVFEWEAHTGPRYSYEWCSGEFFTPVAKNYGALTVDFDEMPDVAIYGFDPMKAQLQQQQVVVTIWLDGEMLMSRPVFRREVVGLPPSRKGCVWQVSIQGWCEMKLLALVEDARAAVGV